jgi:hypothetical protein
MQTAVTLEPAAAARLPVVFKTLLLLVVLWLLAPAHARAAGETVVISTGREGGSYFYIGERLKSAITLTETTPRPRGLVVTSRGSMENLARLDDAASEVNVALTQADALDTYILSHPDFVDRFLVLGKAGPECALLIAARDGPLSSAADLKQDRGMTLSVDDDNSGAAITYARLVQLDSAFENTRPVPVDTMEALLELKGDNPYSKLSGALVIQRPQRASAPVKVLLDNRDTYKLVPIAASDVSAQATPHGYKFREVEVGGWYTKENPKVQTICTEGLLLASKVKLSKEMRARISSIMLEQGDQIIRSEE